MVDQVEAGQGRVGHVHGPFAADDFAVASGRDGVHDRGHGVFPLAGDDEGAPGVQGGLGRRGHIRSSRHHDLAPAFGLGHAGKQALALHEHGRDHDYVGEFPVFLGQGAYVAVHEARRPGPGEQGGHGQEPQGRQQGLAVGTTQDLLETPK